MIIPGHSEEHRLTLDPIGKFSYAFFSETTHMIKAKLYMNVVVAILDFRSA
jgi:hypothetical protein